MLRKLSLLPALAFAAIAVAQPWWENKPFMEWTMAEVERMMNESPWAALTPLKLMPRTSLSVSPFPVNLRVSLLSAKPIREAYLRRISLMDRLAMEKTVRVEDLSPRSAADESQAKLRKFIESYPDDVRVRGDKLRIVVAVAAVQYFPTDVDPKARREDDVRRSSFRRGNWLEQLPPEFLREAQVADWLGNTFLSTRAGNRVEIVDYDPPQMDMLEAKFYFPRTLPDGTTFVTLKDKELRFETRIAGKTIKVRFDLGKMMYRGKLEM